MAGIYLHIPFCKQACHYCDFHFSTNLEIHTELINCMEQEIILQQNYLQHEKINTIYFGGGTPSLLPPEEIGRLLRMIDKLYNVNHEPEITLEANPDDLTLSALHAFKALGVNRLSIGIQSFQNNTLRFLNRAHDNAAALQSVALAREAGFQNISIDIIYAIPGQTEEEWLINIRQAVQLHPEHISAYSLTIEEKTTFGRWAANGKLNLISDDVAAAQFEVLIDELEKNGYIQYEVSNFCKPGYNSRHNSSYWKEQKYLGIGPGAHSFNLTSRQYNISNNYAYVKSLQSGKIPFDSEVLTAQDHINEYILTTLRTQWGCDVEKLKVKFNYDILTIHKNYLDDLINKRLVVLENNLLKLSKAGRLFADKISSDLFLVS